MAAAVKGRGPKATRRPLVQAESLAVLTAPSRWRCVQELEAVGAGPELDRMVAEFDAARAKKAGATAGAGRR